MARLANSHWHKVGIQTMVSLLAALWLTGIALYLVPVEKAIDFGERALFVRRSLVIIHGIAVWGFCILFGHSIWPHVRKFSQVSMRNWRSLLGLFSVTTFCLVGLSGLLLLYGATWLQPYTYAVHWWVGVITPLLVFTHAKMH